MQRIILFFITVFLFTTINAQQQRLKVGDEFSFRNTKFTQSKTNSKESEAIVRQQISWKVVDVTDESYWIDVDYNLIGSYNRLKNEKSDQWKSRLSEYPELSHNKNKYYQTSNYSLFNLDTIRLHLSHTGELLDVEIIDSLIINLPELKPVIENNITQTWHSLFFALPESLQVNDKINYDNTQYQVKEVTPDYISFIHNENTTKSVNRTELKVNLVNGFIIEQIHYQNTSKINDSLLLKERTVLIKDNDRPYKCSFSFNGSKKDTIITNTNVTIRGKITNPSFSHHVSVFWGISMPGGYDRCEIITDLQPDSTFEIRFHIDDIKKVEFHHNEKAELYLMPGDDIYLTLDMNQFDETIRVTGIGSNHANYYADKFLFYEKEKLFSNDIYVKSDQFKNYTNKSYYDIVNQFISKRIQFLERYKEKLAPEIYLAEYYETITHGVEKLMRFNRNRSYFAKKYEFEPDKDIPVNYFDFENLIHADNDLMMFMNDYGHFIRHYAFFYLEDKMNSMTGKGHLISPEIENYLDFVFESRYNLSHKFYTGYTNYTLKYQVVDDALERGSRETYTKLYKRFIEEYPESKMAIVLTEAFKRAEKATVGALAYNFELEDTEGNRVRLSDFRGKAVYISFFSTGYDDYIKRIEWNKDTLENIFKDKDVSFLFVSMNHSSDQSIQIMNDIEFKATKLIATEDQADTLREKFFFSAIPHHIIIDVDGRIIKRDAPYLSELVHQPDELLKGLESRYQTKNNEKTIRNLRIVLISLGVFVLFGLLAWFIYRRRAAQKLKQAALSTKVRELELTAIRVQMNPHFMYNCLNSIQNLVQKRQNDDAHQYLSKFAELIRSVLKNSDKEEICLATELDMIRNYVELEKLRFDIDFEVPTNQAIDNFSIFLPPLILQPLVENAILHGLAPKSSDRKLEIDIQQKNDHDICISVIDNGVGRNSAEHKSSSNGKGIHFSRERLNLLSDKYGQKYKMLIEDLKTDDGEPKGTKVQICFPEE